MLVNLRVNLPGNCEDLPLAVVARICITASTPRTRRFSRASRFSTSTSNCLGDFFSSAAARDVLLQINLLELGHCLLGLVFVNGSRKPLPELRVSDQPKGWVDREGTSVRDLCQRRRASNELLARHSVDDLEGYFSVGGGLWGEDVRGERLS